MTADGSHMPAFIAVFNQNNAVTGYWGHPMTGMIPPHTASIFCPMHTPTGLFAEWDRHKRVPKCSNMGIATFCKTTRAL